MKRFPLLYVFPALGMMLLATAPLWSGEGTLYMRDVLTSHYPLKVSQAEAFAAGELPLVDPHRAGGQPLLGNPNGLPLYPTNVFFLFADPLWALNAHFWLHWLLAPFAFFAFARAWGLRPPAAWAAGVCYAGSGFFLSLFNLYNLVAGAALTPAFLAAVLRAGEPQRPHRSRAVVAAGITWGLLLLAGDPFFAALALLLAFTAVLARWGAPGITPHSLGAVLLGTLLATPLLVEFLRILPLSFRGHWRFSPGAALAQSWNPGTAIEWLLPFFFGRPDFAFWGQSFFGGNPPLFYSLFPGVFCLALVVTSGWPRGGLRWWPWAVTLGGMFCAIGAWNPVMHWLYRLPGASTLRFPVKFWLAVAVGSALLCGIGFERLLRPGGTARLARALAAFALLFAGLWLLLNLWPEGLREHLLQRAPERLAGSLFDWQLLRWSGLALLTLGELALLGLALYLVRRRGAASAALLLVVHLGAQCFFLAPLYESDSVEHYVKPPELLALVPPDARVVHGGFGQLFGTISGSILDLFPDSRFFWLTRSHFAQLHPFAGVRWGLEYDFNHSPEGLDSFYVIALTRALQALPDAPRVAVLRASGVDILLLHRPLAADALAHVQLRGTLPAAGHELYVYDLLGSAAPVQLVGDVYRAPEMNSALDTLTDPRFDPRRAAVLPGDGPARRGPPGEVKVLEESTESLEVEVSSQNGGVLTTRRAFLSLYRATIDGEPAEPRVANLHKLAVEVPPGHHEVRLWVDRSTVAPSFALALLAFLGLLLVARRAGEEKA
jgi:hypothetical protein